MAKRVADAIQLVERFVPDLDRRGRRSRNLVLTLLRTHPMPLDRGSYAPGHVTASGLVLAPDLARALLVLHPTLDRWLQPGGHIEPGDADILAAAQREVREETGVVPNGSGMLVGVDVHEIPVSDREPAHLHHDLMFAFVAGRAGPLAGSEHPWRWCPLDELEGSGADSALWQAARRARLWLSGDRR
ncbi:MAG TPA: NUDIX domain-containing protein [Gemmatimonadales bacterium]